MANISSWTKFESGKGDKSHIDLFGQEDEVVSLDLIKSDLPIDLTYLLQHIVTFNALKKLIESVTISKKPTLLDVGSQMGIVACLTAYYEVFYADPRAAPYSINFQGLSIQTLPCEAQDIPAQDCVFDVVTSFHAIEHFGLGRYGDTIDYYGDQNGLKEFARVLKKGGQLIVSVPCRATSRIKFNDSREYRPRDFDKILRAAGFEISSSSIYFHPYAREDNQLATADERELDDYPIEKTAPLYIVHAFKPL